MPLYKRWKSRYALGTLFVSENRPGILFKGCTVYPSCLSGMYACGGNLPVAVGPDRMHSALDTSPFCSRYCNGIRFSPRESASMRSPSSTIWCVFQKEAKHLLSPNKAPCNLATSFPGREMTAVNSCLSIQPYAFHLGTPADQRPFTEEMFVWAVRCTGGCHALLLL